jgi:hypothetical protein
VRRSSPDRGPDTGLVPDPPSARPQCSAARPRRPLGERLSVGPGLLLVRRTRHSVWNSTGACGNLQVSLTLGSGPVATRGNRMRSRSVGGHGSSSCVLGRAGPVRAHVDGCRQLRMRRRPARRAKPAPRAARSHSALWPVNPPTPPANRSHILTDWPRRSPDKKVSRIHGSPLAGQQVGHRTPFGRRHNVNVGIEISHRMFSLVIGRPRPGWHSRTGNESLRDKYSARGLTWADALLWACRCGGRRHVRVDHAVTGWCTGWPPPPTPRSTHITGPVRPPKPGKPWSQQWVSRSKRPRTSTGTGPSVPVDGWVPRPASTGSAAGSSSGPGEAIRTEVDHKLGRCSCAAGARFLTGSRAALTEYPNGEFQEESGIAGSLAIYTRPHFPYTHPHFPLSVTGYS